MSNPPRRRRRAPIWFSRIKLIEERFLEALGTSRETLWRMKEIRFVWCAVETHRGIEFEIWEDHPSWTTGKYGNPRNTDPLRALTIEELSTPRPAAPLLVIPANGVGQALLVDWCSHNLGRLSCRAPEDLRPRSQYPAGNEYLPGLGWFVSKGKGR